MDLAVDPLHGVPQGEPGPGVGLLVELAVVEGPPFHLKQVHLGELVHLLDPRGLPYGLLI